MSESINPERHAEAPLITVKMLAGFTDVDATYSPYARELARLLTVARAEIVRLNETNSELLRQKGAAWGIQFCCNGWECGCQGTPVDPPDWWCNRHAEIIVKDDALRPFDRVAKWLETLGPNKKDWHIVIQTSGVDSASEVKITAADVMAARAALGGFEVSEKVTCKADVSGPWSTRHIDCPNRDKYGEFCGIHSPEKQAERRANRGPTLGESRSMMAANIAERCKKLENALVWCRSLLWLDPLAAQFDEEMKRRGVVLPAREPKSAAREAYENGA